MRDRWLYEHCSMESASTAVLIRPDGYVGWVGDLTHPGLPDALTHLVRTADCDVAHRLPRSRTVNHATRSLVDQTSDASVPRPWLD